VNWETDLDFSDVLNKWPEHHIRELISQSGPEHVKQALGRDNPSPRDLAALLSTSAIPYLEDMARVSNRLTRHHFGRTIALYAPIYLSNVCTSDCVYCGYAIRSGTKGKRLTLTETEIHAECEALAAHGFQNVLLLTGDAPKVATTGYLERAVTIAREHFVSVSVEVYSLDEQDYKRLVERGLEGVTLYMETYCRETYSKVHLKGKKKDFDYRLNAIERAGRAGARRLGIGALLGLDDWRIDSFRTALHAKYLQKNCWQSAISVSFPRLHHTPERYGGSNLPSDREFVQLILAMRIFLPEVGFSLSTREKAGLRDSLIPLGITHMSAGSSTRPGGYSSYGEETLSQFDIEDRRKPEDVVATIRRAGYDPVWKDFDHSFCSQGDRVSPSLPGKCGDL
jgi:2-iminoacetate synthase